FLAAEAAGDLHRLVQGDRMGGLRAADELERRQTEHAQVDPRQAREAPVLCAGPAQRVDALPGRPPALPPPARERQHLGVSTGLEVLPEQREALRVRLVSTQQVDLVERLEGQLA